VLTQCALVTTASSMGFNLKLSSGPYFFVYSLLTLYHRKLFHLLSFLSHLHLDSSTQDMSQSFIQVGMQSLELSVFLRNPGPICSHCNFSLAMV
jgi:hypothetical protein